MNEKERLIKALNSYEYFENNKDKLIDLFVSYYGEEERVNIENKFKNAIFIAYQTPKSYLTKLHKLENIVSKELVAKVLEGNSLGLTQEQVVNYNSFEYINTHPISKYIEFYNQYSLGKTGRKEKTTQDILELVRNYNSHITREELLTYVEKRVASSNIQSLPTWLLGQISYRLNPKTLEADYQDVVNNGLRYIKDILPNLQFSNIDELMSKKEIQELNKVVSKYQVALNEYQNYKQQFHRQYEIANHDENLEKQLKDYYDQEFIKQIRPLIPLECQTNLDEFLKDSKKKYLLDKYVINLLNDHKLANGIECFFTDATKVLEDQRSSPWQKQAIENERIAYFKSKGINLGDNYQSYVQRKDIWPTIKYTSKLEEAKKMRDQNFTLDYNSHTYYNKQIIEKLKQANLVSKLGDFTEILNGNTPTCISPAFSKKDNSLIPLVLINFDHETNNIDHSINHELNHLYELSAISSNKEGYLARCGFDFIEEHYNQQKIPSRRKYEYFNEVINEKIAQEISAKAHEIGYSLFADKTEKYTYQTSYEKMNFIVDGLFEKYKDIILESRKNNNFELLENELGTENIEALNNLFSIFQEHLGGLEFNRLIDDVNKITRSKEEAKEKGITEPIELTPRVKVYKDIMQQTDEIMSRIEEYRHTNSVKL